jgi:hypothetical protein
LVEIVCEPWNSTNTLARHVREGKPSLLSAALEDDSSCFVILILGVQRLMFMLFVDHDRSSASSDRP